MHTNYTNYLSNFLKFNQFIYINVGDTT